jgi:hypothetical protein
MVVCDVCVRERRGGAGWPCGWGENTYRGGRDEVMKNHLLRCEVSALEFADREEEHVCDTMLHAAHHEQEDRPPETLARERKRTH